MRDRWLTTALIGFMLCVPPKTVFASQPAEQAYASGRLIVLYKADTSSARKHALSVHDALVNHVRIAASGAYLLSLRPDTTPEAAKQLADRLLSSSDVASVTPDVIVRPHTSPAAASPFAGPVYGDGFAYPSAISLAASRQLFGNLNLSPAPVAVADTGITSHTALQNVLPGYNFYTLLGNSRSSDYSDPGDGVSAAEAATPPFQTLGCTAKNSSWHGTAMAGIIGAQSNAGYHVEGVAAGAWVLPARALGECGGYLTDVVDAALWSAGVHVPGVPDNLNPVRIVNMSFGADGFQCTAYQSAIDQLTARGVVVVAAGGNDNEDTTQVLPANCSGVLTVVASDRNGDLAAYSARGSNVTLVAPGGESHLGIVTTSDMGTMAPVAETSAGYFGTSISTAIVSGVVSLMISANPALQPANVGKILKATAAPIANCATDCGGGLLNADAAVRVAYEGVSYASPGFANAQVGAQADGIVQVKNVSGLSVTFGGAVFGGINPADFTKVADACSGSTLSDGDSCSVTIRFAPNAAGQRQAILQIPSNMPSMGIGVPLSAAATAAVSGTIGSQGSSSGGGGGCATLGMSVRPDPFLPLLLTLSVAWLARRRCRR